MLTVEIETSGTDRYDGYFEYDNPVDKKTF